MNDDEEDIITLEVDDEAARSTFGELDDEGKPLAQQPPTEPTDVPASKVKEHMDVPEEV
jgi:hypothetical protein